MGRRDIPGGPQLPPPNRNFQIFSDADAEKAFEKAKRAIDELLGVAPKLV
jgi:hypothetical protein